MTCQRATGKQSAEISTNSELPIPTHHEPWLLQEKISVLFTPGQELRYGSQHREAISQPPFSSTIHNMTSSPRPSRHVSTQPAVAGSTHRTGRGTAGQLSTAYWGCRSTMLQRNMGIQPLWSIFFCVYFNPELRKACITAQMPLGVSSWIKS